MTSDASFADLLRRIRAGDAAAAEELVQRDDRFLSRMVNVRLLSDRVRWLFDSEDNDRQRQIPHVSHHSVAKVVVS